MKRHILLLLGITLLAMTDACTKDDQFQQQGILEGPDYALCPCCGGVILNISSNFNNRVDSLPGMKMQEFYNLNFPKTIRFNSILNSKCGNFNYFTITSYKFID